MVILNGDNDIMSLINKYLEDLPNIHNHKDALKHYQVRVTSFNQNYPKECCLSASALAEYGFYFEENNKSIRCYECDFKIDDLNQDSIFYILHKHYKYRSNCTQTLKALEFIVNDHSSNSVQNETESMEIDEDNRPNQHLSKKAKNIFNNEETRFQTFENTKLLLNPKTLAENGFYMVSKETQQNTGMSKSKSLNQSFNSAKEESANQIEKIASLVPALIYIKCAFCVYECLIFKNSLLNTMFKSPMEEHYEKFNKICPVFTESKINQFSLIKLEFSDRHNHFVWLQCLLDFDSATSETVKTLSDILYYPNDLNSKKDDLTVKQIPKVVDQLLINEKSKLNSNHSNSFKDQKGDNVLYVPKSGASNSGPTTSDFSKLQNVLHLSDNVISEKAIHPAYTLYQTRVDSFKEWPATLSQQPADLAKAGFYYFGIKDMVKCFFCNGGLKNWDHNDDPYEDHVRWFPKCQFIRQLMGAEFVEHIKEKYKNQDSGFTNDSSQTSYSDNLSSSLNKNQSLSTNNRNQVKMKRSVSPRTLNSRLDTNIIRKMIDTVPSVTKDSIKQSIEMQLSSTNTSKLQSPIDKKNPSNISNVYGDDFKTPIEMAKLAIELEKNKNDKLEAFKEISDFIICNIDPAVNIENIQNLIMFKYGIFPNHVRILREKGQVDRCFAFVTLNRKDESLCDEIVKDLNQQQFLSKKNENEQEIVLTFKTVWTEFEEKIKPLLNKPVAVSTSMDVEQDNKVVSNPANTDIKPVALLRTDEIIIKETNKAELEKTNSDELVENVNDDKSVLMEENERLKSERLCVICLNKDKNVLFLPCAHLAACLDCSFNLQNCPICRSKIQATVRTYS